MKMVSVPVERVAFHAKIVPRNVARRVAEVMELIPKDPRAPVRPGNDSHLIERAARVERELK